jgi:hypothetical protein
VSSVKVLGGFKEELWVIGKQNVEREYELLLGKHSCDKTTIMANDNHSDTQSLNDDTDQIDDGSAGTYVNG